MRKTVKKTSPETTVAQPADEIKPVVSVSIDDARDILGLIEIAGKTIGGPAFTLCGRLMASIQEQIDK